MNDWCAWSDLCLKGQIMSFESFRVELCDGAATHDEISDAIRSLPHIKPDLHSLPMPGSSYYLRADGQHVIEIELMDYSPVRISCRFTLCHPSCIEGAFLALLRDLMTRFSMLVKICDDVLPEHSRSFSLEEFDEFARIISGYIARRRDEWIRAFGAESLAATTNEVYQHFILPRCRPA